MDSDFYLKIIGWIRTQPAETTKSQDKQEGSGEWQRIAQHPIMETARRPPACNLLLRVLCCMSTAPSVLNDNFIIF
ncbi:hypothetical protein [Oryza sativa Japonica Group]|uniref:Uncharacterized protein n=1 Tax=Oryza sativa subsp. japonica TaxID=39947 RepID=Q657Y9_ORYSJ|nr:hypothetical protein [Oryza sativa Japonica Group]